MIQPLIFTKEIKNRPLSPCNKIHAISIPAGVQAFISWIDAPRTKDIYELSNNSIIALKENGIFSAPQIPYLTTVGTSETKGELILNDANSSHIEIIQDGNNMIDLREDLTEALMEREVKSFSNDLLNKFDKIFNLKEELLLNKHTVNSASWMSVLKIESCDFDEIECLFTSVNTSPNSSTILVKLNGTNVFSNYLKYQNTAYQGQNQNVNPTFKNLKGQKLEILYSGIIYMHITKKTKRVF